MDILEYLDIVVFQDIRELVESLVTLEGRE